MIYLYFAIPLIITLLSLLHTLHRRRESPQLLRPRKILSWDDYFMAVAMLSSMRSKDPNRQVGACIVDRESNKILGIGYNGFPRGCVDNRLPWAKTGNWLDTKYPYVCHAELNAIMNKNSASVDGSILYSTLYPCNECAKIIIQSGISEVRYLEKRDGDSSAASQRLLDMAGVVMKKLTPVSETIELCMR